MVVQIQRLPELSVFFPCYNEEENVPQLLEQALAVFPRFTDRLEIIIVDDGSRDRTKEIAEGYAARHPQVRVVSQPNGGYGKALRTGFEQARFEYVFFADGDLQFDLEDFSRLVPLAPSSDLVIGYRLTRADGFKRIVTMKMLKIWSFILLGYPWYIRDTNCAFKLFKKSALDRLPLVSDGAMISTELLLRAHRAGMKIAQTGVRHLPRIHGEPTGQKAGVIATAVRETFLVRRAVAAKPELSAKEINSSEFRSLHGRK